MEGLENSLLDCSGAFKLKHASCQMPGKPLAIKVDSSVVIPEFLYFSDSSGMTKLEVVWAPIVALTPN
jgi:hypothetical protein